MELSELRERAIAEWPATLAILTLIVGHFYLTIIAGQDLTPIGIPLFAAIIVFLAGELGRRLM